MIDVEGGSRDLVLPGCRARRPGGRDRPRVRPRVRPLHSRAPRGRQHGRLLLVGVHQRRAGIGWRRRGSQSGSLDRETSCKSRPSHPLVARYIFHRREPDQPVRLLPLPAGAWLCNGVWPPPPPHASARLPARLRVSRVLASWATLAVGASCGDGTGICNRLRDVTGSAQKRRDRGDRTRTWRWNTGRQSRAPGSRPSRSNWHRPIDRTSPGGRVGPQSRYLVGTAADRPQVFDDSLLRCVRDLERNHPTPRANFEPRSHRRCSFPCDGNVSLRGRSRQRKLALRAALAPRSRDMAAPSHGARRRAHRAASLTYGGERESQRHAVKSSSSPKGPSPTVTRSCQGRQPPFCAELATNITPRKTATTTTASVIFLTSANVAINAVTMYLPLE
jgi:hypothetical protein